ncbi:MAG: hypothetical protein JSS86_00270 [Cyanobacteria bacterium SZAS LIN-2]|nr:hypothetical protein [Cyanobacteria bacterium SZAS LIN-2]
MKDAILHYFAKKYVVEIADPASAKAFQLFVDELRSALAVNIPSATPDADGAGAAVPLGVDLADLDFLDKYETSSGTTWCWRRGDRASQEFSSEEEALEAWRSARLEWSDLSDFAE